MVSFRNLTIAALAALTGVPATGLGQQVYTLDPPADIARCATIQAYSA